MVRQPETHPDRWDRIFSGAIYSRFSPGNNSCCIRGTAYRTTGGDFGRSARHVDGGLSYLPLGASALEGATNKCDPLGNDTIFSCAAVCIRNDNRSYIFWPATIRTMGGVGHACWVGWPVRPDNGCALASVRLAPPRLRVSMPPYSVGSREAHLSSNLITGAKVSIRVLSKIRLDQFVS